MGGVGREQRPDSKERRKSSLSYYETANYVYDIFIFAAVVISARNAMHQFER